MLINMKQRLLAASLILLLLMTPIPARAEAAQPVVITDAAGLLAMAGQPSPNGPPCNPTPSSWT